MKSKHPDKPKFEDNPDYNIPDECVHNPKPKVKVMSHGKPETKKEKPG